MPRVHWQGLELGLMASGVPDTNGCYQGQEFWVEFKWTDTYAVGLEALQVGWILRRMRAGGRVFVATWRETAGGPRSGPAESALFIHEGWDAAVLRAEGLLGAPPVLIVEGPQSTWDWGLVQATLVEWPMSRR